MTTLYTILYSSKGYEPIIPWKTATGGAPFFFKEDDCLAYYNTLVANYGCVYDFEIRELVPLGSRAETLLNQEIVECQEQFLKDVRDQINEFLG